MTKAILQVIQAGHRAQTEVIGEPSPFEDGFSGPLDSWINTKAADEIWSILDVANESTPPFLRGVLLTPRQHGDILQILSCIAGDLEWGAKFQHSSNNSHRAGQAMLGGMLGAILSDAAKATP